MLALLMRHGESEKNVQNRFGDSSTAFALTALGVKQVEEAALRLAGRLREQISRTFILASDEPRVAATAQIVSERLGLNAVIDHDLRPIDSGLLSGLTEIEAELAFPDVMRAKRLYRSGSIDGVLLNYPSGEAVASFQRRIVNAFTTHLREMSGCAAVVFIGHQSTITALLSHYRSEETGQPFYSYFALGPCRVSEISIVPGTPPRVTVINGDGTDSRR